MTSEERWTGVILANELHFLALEEKIRLMEGNNSHEILDCLPITRLIGQSEVGLDPRPIEKDVEIWETWTETPTWNLKCNYNIGLLAHSNFNLQNYTNKCTERGFNKIPINYLELQLDIEPESRNIYRIGLKNRRLPPHSDTRASALERINQYRTRYDLYPEIRHHTNQAVNLWLGKLHCLEIYAILRGDKKLSSTADWRKARNVTERYLRKDRRTTDDFFPNLEKITGGLIACAKKFYDTTELGWQLDGLVFQRPN